MRGSNLEGRREEVVSKVRGYSRGTLEVLSGVLCSRGTLGYSPKAARGCAAQVGSHCQKEVQRMRAKGLPHSGEIFSNISLEFGHRDDIRFLEARAA